MGGVEASAMAIFDKCAEWSIPSLGWMHALPDALDRHKRQQSLNLHCEYGHSADTALCWRLVESLSY
jgi:hypothetical protein